MKYDYRLFLLIIFITGILSCQSKIEKVYYPNGQLKFVGRVINDLPEGLCSTFYDNGEIMQISNWSMGKMNGLRKFYYKNGVIKEESYWESDSLNGRAIYYFPNRKIKIAGQFKSGKGNGWFQYYDSLGKLTSMTEFVNIEGRPMMNQDKRFSEAGEIIKDKSHYIRIKPEKDTLTRNQNNQIIISVEGPVFNQSMRVILAPEGSFSTSKHDTIEGKGLMATINIKPEKKGVYHLHGKVEEYTDRIVTPKGYRIESKDIFFNRKFIVK